MNRRPIVFVRIALAVVMLAVLAPRAAARGGTTAGDRPTVGVAIVPRTGGFADGSERSLFQVMGQISWIDHVHGASTPADILRILATYRRSARKVDPLILGGHGPEPGNDYPGILLGSARLGPEHVDRTLLMSQLIRLEKELANLERAERRQRNPAVSRRIGMVRQDIRARRNQLDALDGIGDVMAPKGTIWLYNCNALQGPNGFRFATELGKTLFGRMGGQVIGSRTNVGLGNDVTRFVADMRGKNWSVSGSWRRIAIAPIYLWPAPRDHAWSRLTAADWDRKKAWFHIRSATSTTRVYKTGGGLSIARTGNRLELFDAWLYGRWNHMVDKGPVPEDPKYKWFEVWESDRDRSRAKFWFPE